MDLFFENQAECKLQRVLVLSSEQPVWVGIIAILGKESDLDVFTLPMGEQGKALQMIEHLKPAVIVVDEKLPAEELAKILSLQKAYADLRVVVVSLRENQLQVFDKRAVMVHELRDFIAAVQSR